MILHQMLTFSVYVPPGIMLTSDAESYSTFMMLDVHANRATSIMNVEYDSASDVNIIPGGTYTENVTVTLK